LAVPTAGKAIEHILGPFGLAGNWRLQFEHGAKSRARFVGFAAPDGGPVERTRGVHEDSSRGICTVLVARGEVVAEVMEHGFGPPRGSWRRCQLVNDAVEILAAEFRGSVEHTAGIHHETCRGPSTIVPAAENVEERDRPLCLSWSRRD
jgi:hypothetical protein